MQLEKNALEAQMGDKIYDNQTKTIGVVVGEGIIGNYDKIYVNFDGTIKTIVPMNDAQIKGRYQKIIKE